MKRLLVFSVLVVLATSLASFQLLKIRAARAGELPEDYARTPNITLRLPDQDYLASLNNLNLSLARNVLTATAREVVIPSLENTKVVVKYNPALGVLESASSPRDYVVQTVDLIAELSPHLGEEQIVITPKYALRDRLQDSLATYNNHLLRIYSSPLTVNLKDGSTFSNFALTPTFLRSILMPVTTDVGTALDINKTKLVSYLQAHLTPKEKLYFSADATYANVRQAVNSRFMAEPVSAVLGVDDGPTSDGSLAAKYLEVDLSQQKMYFFMNGFLYNSYRISTGEEYPTPVGEFHILNKEPKAFSSIYNVWMPYWMGITYASDIGAYIGLHELAYADGGNGKRLYRYGYYIGDRKTGGCVAMEPKDAPEIYHLSDVGMLVRVVP